MFKEGGRDEGDKCSYAEEEREGKENLLTHGSHGAEAALKLLAASPSEGHDDMPLISPEKSYEWRLEIEWSNKTVSGHEIGHLSLSENRVM